MIRTEIIVRNKLGLHARATAKLVTLATGFRSTIRIGRNERMIDAKNMMAVLMMGAGKGSILSLLIDGDDEEQALHAIEGLFARLFDEAE